MRTDSLPVLDGDSGQECCPPPLVPPLDADRAQPLARAFAALGDPARLRLYTLIAAQDEPVCACSLFEPIGRSQPTTSHHLKVLYEAGLVTRERRGSWIWYSAVPGRLRELMDAVSGQRTPVA